VNYKILEKIYSYGGIILLAIGLFLIINLGDKIRVLGFELASLGIFSLIFRLYLEFIKSESERKI
jgi:hypothetical protein